MKKSFLLTTLISIVIAASAQIGGDNTYEFLNLNVSARIAALGGNQIAVRDNDPFLGFDNPSLLNKEMDNKLALSYVSYLADVGLGFASYTKNIDSIGTFNLGVKYIDYGSFTETDNAGNEIGDFTAGEYAFVLGYAYEIDTNYSVGANLKTIYSTFYDYNSTGLGVDVGITRVSNTKREIFTLLLKNMGAQLSTYNDVNESLPFEIQLGFSKRFKNVPFRLGVIMQHLQDWDLTYDNPNDAEESTILGANSDGNNNRNENGFFENLLRHYILNAEFLVSENFNVRFGYNYLRRAELRIDEKLGTVGFSWGFGMRVNRFHLSYARSAFHQAGATNTFSVSTKLSDFIN